MRKTTSLSHLSISSLVSYGNEMQHYIILYTKPADLKGDWYASFTKAKELLEKGFQKKRKSDIDLKEPDTDRDRAFLHLKYLVMAALYDSNAEVCEMAVNVKEVIERVGIKVYKMRYMVETSDIHKLVTQLRNADHHDAVTTIGLVGAIDNLDRANAAFEQSVSLQAKEKTKMKETSAPTKVRKEYEASIRRLCAYVEAQSIVSNERGWSMVVQAIELLNERYSIQQKRHRTYLKKRRERKQELAKQEQPKPAEQKME